MFSQLKNIASGWAKYAGLMATGPEEVAMSMERMQLCAGCEYAKESKFLAFINGDASYAATIFCDLCKCPCHQKSLVAAENCPLGRWREVQGE